VTVSVKVKGDEGSTVAGLVLVAVAMLVVELGELLGRVEECVGDRARPDDPKDRAMPPAASPLAAQATRTSATPSGNPRLTSY
jgi:hypothetical protein